jgi:excinuclease UvrABC nuclease subunit
MLSTQMKSPAERLDFESAARLRDRHERLARLRDELAAFRGEVNDLSFVYVVRGFEGADRVYVIRGGRVRDQFARPHACEERAAAANRVRAVFAERDRGLVGLSATEAAEILMVAAWFRGRPEERARTTHPREWMSPTAAGPTHKRRTQPV